MAVDPGQEKAPQRGSVDPSGSPEFDIQVDTAQLDPGSTERHALEGGYFRFVDAGYTVEPLGPERCQVTLTSRYVAKSSVNAYGERWASYILGDFQERVLRVLSRRFERWHREGRPAAVAASPSPSIDSGSPWTSISVPSDPKVGLAHCTSSSRSAWPE